MSTPHVLLYTMLYCFLYHVLPSVSPAAVYMRGIWGERQPTVVLRPSKVLGCCNRCCRSFIDSLSKSVSYLWKGKKSIVLVVFLRSVLNVKNTCMCLNTDALRVEMHICYLVCLSMWVGPVDKFVVMGLFQFSDKMFR